MKTSHNPEEESTSPAPDAGKSQDKEVTRYCRLAVARVVYKLTALENTLRKAGHEDQAVRIRLARNIVEATGTSLEKDL